MNVARELVALSITFLGAGFLGTWVIFPERLGAVERLFLSLALSVPATLLAAAPGLATHSLAAWNVVACLAALAVAALCRARRRIAAALVDLGSGRRRRAPRFLRMLLVCLMATVTWFAVLVPQGIEHADSGDPNGTIVYYHWGIVSKVVEDGGLPASLLEWGKPREFPYEYAFSVMHGAATANLAGDTGFVLEEHYRLAMVLFAFAAMLALWRRWLPPWWAWLAAVLTMNVSRIETRLLVYKPEAFAFILVVWSAWLLDEALERRSRRWGALAGLVLACSFLAHPVGSLLVAPLWGGILLGRMLPSAWQRWRARRGGPPTDPAAVGLLGLRALVPAVLVFAVLFVGLRTVIGTTGQNLSQSAVGGVDETRVVYNLAYVSSNPFARPRVPECSHPFGIYSTQRPFFSSHAAGFFFDLHAVPSLLLICGGLVLLAGTFVLQPPPRLGRWPVAAKRAVLTWSFYAIGVYLLALLICTYYSTWVPQRVGPMRLMPYWALIFPGLIAGAGWAGAALASHPRARIAGVTTPASPRWAGWLGASVAVVPALVVAALAIWIFTPIGSKRDPGVAPFYLAAPRAGGLSAGALDAYHWISRRLPKRALILTNGYIEGALGMISRRTGVLDGRAPFAQPEPWRAEAVDLLARSRRFFLHPAHSAAPGGATYVLAGQPNVNLGGTFFPTNFPALSRDPDLSLVYRREGVAIYRVRRPGRPVTGGVAERAVERLLTRPHRPLASC